MAEDHSEFAITMRGYDRLQVDQRLESLSRQLVEARNEVASLDHRAMTLAGQLAEAQRRLRESDKPSSCYAMLKNSLPLSWQRPTARQIAC